MADINNATLSAHLHPGAEDQLSVTSVFSIRPDPDTITKLVGRVRAMATRLLPVEVELDVITDATGPVITPEVVNAFRKAGGDFEEAVPFCLLRARHLFIREGMANPTDYEETLCRATACEVIARRMVRIFPHESLRSVMSARFRYRDSDGDVSAASCALEMAIDGHCTIFLSSNETQEVVNALWSGRWVQENNEDQDIDYVEYHRSPDRAGSFWDHLDPLRLSVPRYQSLLRVIIWLVYLFVYSQSVKSPLDAINRSEFDGWEIALYIMTFAFFIEESVKFFKNLRLANNPLNAISFWVVVNFLIDALLLTALSLRVAGMRLDLDDDAKANLMKRSFQVLSCAAPLIWMKLFTVFEAYKTVGVLEVVVFRMLRESVIFFILLGVLGLGFAQSMYALDAADGEINEFMRGFTFSDDPDNPGQGSTTILLNNLVQALLGSPEFGIFEFDSERFGYPFGLIIYYSWNFFTTIILVNVLIALFGSAYQEISDNATDEYLAFFAGKTIDMIRAPDQFVYVAPFNLIEIVFIVPLEFILPTKDYAKLNRVVMSVIFFVPLVCIAIWEAGVVHARRGVLYDYFATPIPEDDEDPKVIDPETTDPAGVISKVPFDELVQAFPNTSVTESTVILREIHKMREALDSLEKKITR